MSKLNNLIDDLKDVEAITDPLEQEWRLIALRKSYKLTIGEFKRLRSLIKAQPEGDEVGGLK